MADFDWTKLLNSDRRRRSSAPSTEARRQFERDFDRILFSTPVRRLADKTQVFPLERNDSVRTRLTHSHEVSNLARSIGTQLVFPTPGEPAVFGPTDERKRDVPALLAALALVHDIGNPPFGHQGEQAIQRWFASSESQFGGVDGLSPQQKADFLRFEGNAQTFRLVARLQMRNDDNGLNLTYACLGALLKYTVPAYEADKDATYAGATKPGFFCSEAKIVEDVWAATGLHTGIRHPLTYIVEACDDIAYSVVDAEDAVKKGIASYPDLRDAVANPEGGSADTVVAAVLKKTEEDRQEVKAAAGKHTFSPAEYNDHSMQLFRAHAISAMVRAVTTSFVESLRSMLDGTFRGDLIETSAAGTLAKRLKAFDRAVAYRHRSVLAIELHGYRVITSLMNVFWKAICDREGRDASTLGKRVDPSSAYVYGLISENYRRVFEAPGNESKLPIRYREAQLLCDMIAGMTDTFAVSLFEDLRERGILREA
jgi:dGTPase